MAGGYQNTALGNNAAVAGGWANYARGDNSAIAGGGAHTNLTGFGFIGGGYQQTIEPFSRFSVIAGGESNEIHSNSTHSVIAGGQFNNVGTNAPYAIVAGGSDNLAAGTYSFAAGHRAKANHQGTFVWADSTNADFVSTSSNQFLIRASGGVGIGVTNPSVALEVAGAVKAAAFQGNGSALNSLSGANLAPASVATAALSDGAVTSAKIADGSIAAADVNAASFATTFWKANGNAGTTPAANFLGTTDNRPLEVRVNNSRAFRLEPIANDVAHSNLVNVVGGSSVNFVVPFKVGATIAGGGGLYGGPPGATNRVLDDFGTVGGGNGNSSGFYGTVGGGILNVALGDSSTVAGGSQNSSVAYAAAIAGGIANAASGSGASIGGGLENISSGAYATIAGGYQNTASGSYSFAAGRRALAANDGTFVWADSQDANFSSTTNNQFSIRAQNGVRLNTDTSLFCGNQVRQMLNLWGTNYGIGVQGYTLYFRTDDSFPGGGFAWYQGGAHNDSGGNPGGGKTLMTLGANGQLTVVGSSGNGVEGHSTSSGASGVYGQSDGAGYGVAGRTTGAGSAIYGDNANASGWAGYFNGNVRVTGSINPASDRNVKAGFASIDTKAILEKVAALPITRWHYTNDVATPHIGPMAQDFSAAFQVGADDKHIATVDADGVALAAIQGLNQKLEALEQQVQRKDADNAELKRRLDALEKNLSGTASARRVEASEAGSRDL